MKILIIVATTLLTTTSVMAHPGCGPQVDKNYSATDEIPHSKHSYEYDYDRKWHHIRTVPMPVPRPNDLNE